MEPKLIKCPDGCEDGLIVIYNHTAEEECWTICPTCSGEGTIPDDSLEDILSDVIQTKEINYGD